MTSKEINIRKMVFNGLDKIPKQSQEIAKAWGINKGKSINITTLKEIVEKSKLTATSKDIETFVIQYNKTLDTFYSVCAKKVNEFGGTTIPIETIRILVREIKKAMNLNK